MFYSRSVQYHRLNDILETRSLQYPIAYCILYPEVLSITGHFQILIPWLSNIFNWELLPFCCAQVCTLVVTTMIVKFAPTLFSVGLICTIYCYDTKLWLRYPTKDLHHCHSLVHSTSESYASYIFHYMKCISTVWDRCLTPQKHRLVDVTMIDPCSISNFHLQATPSFDALIRIIVNPSFKIKLRIINLNIPMSGLGCTLGYITVCVS